MTGKPTFLQNTGVYTVPNYNIIFSIQLRSTEKKSNLTLHEAQIQYLGSNYDTTLGAIPFF